MDYKDYYKILGVDKNADSKAIKKAFRKLARESHPDVKPGDKAAEARFKEISEAYEVLGDPEKRKKYDQLGANWDRFQQGGGRPGDFDWSQWAAQQAAAGGPGGPQVRYTTNVNMDDLQDMFGGNAEFSDFFTQMFGGMGGMPGAAGGRGRAARASRGQDYEQEVPITLAEAYHGTTRRLEKDGRQLEVKIPAGAATGTRVRMSGEGAPGAGGGQAGDLFLRVVVEPDARFERKGDDLVTRTSVDLYTAVLGGEASVETLSGRLVLRIPAGTQSGSALRLRGQGMPRLRQPGEKGDLLVKVQVQLPRDLSERERQLFEELRALKK